MSHGQLLANNTRDNLAESELFSVTELLPTMHALAIKKTAPEIRVTKGCVVYEIPGIEEIQDGSVGMYSYSDHRELWSELTSSQVDYPPGDPELDDQDDQGQVCTCACTWRCSI